MIFLPEYSRTLRAGALYESEIFSRVPDDDETVAKNRKKGVDEILNYLLHWGSEAGV